MTIYVQLTDARSSFLSMVNNVLIRLREPQVTSVTQTAYSTLIGKFINDTKRQVEDAYNWNCLYASTTVTTISGTSLYTLTGLGTRFKFPTANNINGRNQLINVPIQTIINYQQLAPIYSGIPTYYAFKGVNQKDMNVEFYPTPDSAYTIKFTTFAPQSDLMLDSDIIFVDSDVVVAGAYSRAIAERGEDGGLASSEAAMIFKGFLSDLISLEAGRFVESESWVAT